MKSVFILIVAAVTSFSSAYANEEAAGGGADGRFGPGKAIEAFDKEQGFKLSDTAANRLGVKFSGLKGAGPWRVPKSSLIQLKQSFGVYRKFEGWISYVLVHVQKDEGAFVVITSEDLQTSDDIATAGVSFLRMTDSDLNAGTVDSCAH